MCTGESGYFLIRWRGKVGSSLYRVTIQHGRRMEYRHVSSCSYFKPDSVCGGKVSHVYRSFQLCIANDDSVFWDCYRIEGVCLSFIISLQFLSRMWHIQSRNNKKRKVLKQPKATVIRAIKTCNLSRNIAAKRIEQQCFAFFIPSTKPVSQQKSVLEVANVCCRK